MVDKQVLVGELSLDGRVRPIMGALSFALVPRPDMTCCCRPTMGLKLRWWMASAYPLHSLPKPWSF